ncbi:MAG: glutathione S-transferase family protein [Alphaproteobacteria bacterium]|nr:glutathione S-transferase family protein [Alphaproteobacteria bacterium]
MIKVYGVHGSPFVRKVYIMLGLKGISFEMVQQRPFANDPEYKMINPLGKVPTLVDGELTLCDSKVICRYIENAYPEPRLYPEDPAERAKADWLEEFSGTSVTELATGIFFQRFMRPRVFKQEPDEKFISEIITNRLPPLLAYLEGHIPQEGFVFGDFTMTDLAIVSPFINASYAGYEVDPESWPRLAGLINRVKANPEVAAVLAEEARMFGAR